MARVVLLSDTHLSPVHGFFWENWRLARDALNAAPPDLVIVTGDLCINGAESDADMAFAGEAMRGLQMPALFLPGNHDVGDEPPGQTHEQLIDASRLARWNGTFGSDRFCQPIGGWRLIGINAQLCGSGLEEEEAQYEWLAAQLADGGGPIALFLHKPMFLDDPGEDMATASTLNPAPRARLRAMLSGTPVRLIVSGHLHSHRDVTHDGIRYLWAPALSFTHGAHGNATPMVAAMTLDFAPGNVQIGFLDLPGLKGQDLAELKGHGKYKFLRDMPPCPPVM
jgi:3',5'-cyclic AMP phosphodiesterase CpdA